MQINSLGFIFLFLPITAVIYYLTPARLKTGCLCLISLLFYGLLDPVILTAMLLLSVFDYGCAVFLFRWRGDVRRRKIIMTIVLLKAIVICVYLFSYFWHEKSMPLGVIVITLSALGYILDMARGELEVPDHFIDFLTYCLFFGRLYMGPLASAGEIMPQMRKVKPSFSGIGRGIMIFSTGLFKTAVLNKELQLIISWCDRIEQGQQTTLSAWLWALANAMLVYFTISGYCDMAVGIGRIFSVRLPRNLYYPLQAKTVAELFYRLNITVNDYIKKNLTMLPIIGQDGAVGENLSFFAGCLLMPLWFGPSINHIAWGACMALIIMVERKLSKGMARVFPSIVLRLITFIIGVTSFCIFSVNGLGASLTHLGYLMGVGGVGLYNDEALYILFSNLLPIAVALFACTSVTDKIGRYLENNVPLLSELILGAYSFLLLAVSTSFLMENVRWLSL